MSASEIITKIEDWAGKKVVNLVSLGGGCIANANRVSLESGESYFMKHGANQPDMFLREANGLQELEKANCIRVPKVYLADEKFLLLEYIEPGPRTPDFFYRFGRQLAQLHRFSAQHFGFYEDNYIGATPQLNLPSRQEANHWFDFYYNKRLLYQYKLAEKKGLVGDELKNGFLMLDTRIEEMMEGSEEPPSLLHGDLWKGNFMVDGNSNPCLVDPATYYGHREAELAMTKLFGGFNEEFYSAYRSSYPLPDGYDHRENIYMLYHVLNHLNLFGNSYYGQAVRLVWSYL
jgi:fructosamine-3-kinase